MTKRDYIQAQRIKPIGEEGINTCRRILETKTFAKINEVMVDTFSASAILTVYDNISDANKQRFTNLPVAKIVDVAFKLLAK